MSDNGTGTAVGVRIGADVVTEQLVDAGVTTMFGVPGVQLDYLIDSLAQRADRIRYVSCRHEQGAAHMADGYARAGGRTGVFAVVPGPGVLNSLTGLATAYACSSPVVCIAANLPTRAIDANLGLLHEIPGQETVLASVTKRVVAVREVADLGAAMRRALKAASSGRPQPVAVSVPEDLLKLEALDVMIEEVQSPVRPGPDPADLQRAAALIAAAERPVLVCGGGAVASGADQALARFAEQLRIPVITTSNGRGAISDHNDWALTSLPGRDILAGADLVVFVGSRGLRMDGTPLVPHTPTILINAEHAHLGAPRRPVVALHSDARVAVEALAASVAAGSSAWTVADLDHARSRAAERIAQYGELAEWVSALRSGMADEDVLVGELTQVAYLSRVAYPVYRPRTFLSPGYQGTLGYGVPTAIGAQLARPDVRTVSISGDGGFAYGMSELLTAVAHDVATTFVVFNDGAFGNVLRTQLEQFEGRSLGTRLHNPKFADVGRVFGLEGRTATSPAELTGQLREAAAGNRPTLIEVPVGSFRDPGPLVREGGHVPQS